MDMFMKYRTETEGMTQPARCSSHKHKNLSLDSKHSWKEGWMQQHTPVTLQWGNRNRRMLGQSTRQSNKISSRLTCLKQ